MLEAPKLMTMAQDLARHAGMRQSQIAKNVANADVPGYRAQDIAGFADTYSRQMDVKATRPGHLTSAELGRKAEYVDIGGPASPNGNNVSIEAELVRGTDAKSQHSLALTVYRNSLDILRAAMGRGR